MLIPLKSSDMSDDGVVDVDVAAVSVSVAGAGAGTGSVGVAFVGPLVDVTHPVDVAVVVLSTVVSAVFLLAVVVVYDAASDGVCMIVVDVVIGMLILISYLETLFHHSCCVCPSSSWCTHSAGF
jgi:hypothetical protein